MKRVTLLLAVLVVFASPTVAEASVYVPPQNTASIYYAQFYKPAPYWATYAYCVPAGYGLAHSRTRVTWVSDTQVRIRVFNTSWTYGMRVDRVSCRYS
jgi:hypothetical protein